MAVTGEGNGSLIGGLSEDSLIARLDFPATFATAPFILRSCERLNAVPMDLKDLLVKQGFDLGKVIVLRHRPAEPSLRRVLPWLAAEKPEVFNAYQKAQNPDAEKALMKADVVASFIALEDEKAVFVGLYRRTGEHPVTDEQYWAISENLEMKPFGLGGIRNRETAMWFDLKPLDVYSEWKGRLIVRWPAGRLWWRWAKSNDFQVYAIHEESLLDAEMPRWDNLCLTWKDLTVLPTKWRAALRQWRGIYYIFDVSIEKGYVGSACGEENILGRWLDYAASGHGGNKKLREREPRKFLFTILQRTSPDMERDEVLQLEASWKERLHTRDHGLNDN
jgi:hypothetical protein